MSNSQRILVDSDGENIAVRMFLMYYGGSNGVRTESMRSYLTMAGYGGAWPEWANKDMHLTKAGAQLWIRHLFALEGQQSNCDYNDKLLSAARISLEVLQKHRQMKGEYPVGMLGARAVEEIEAAFREIYDNDKE